MPVTSEYQQIFNVLAQQTRVGACHWQESGRDGEYVTRTADYAVMISINKFIEMFSGAMVVKSPIAFVVLLPEGLMIAKFEVTPEELDYQAARDLYELASKQAVRKPQMLEQLARQLAS